MSKRGVIIILIGLIVTIITDSVFSNKIVSQQKKAYKRVFKLVASVKLHNSKARQVYKKIYSKRWLSRINIMKLSIPIFPYRLKEKILAKVTAYEPSEVSCGKSADGRTSIMMNAYELTGIAADPLALPYGTVLYIPGAGYKTVDDTGSAMKKSWRQKKEVHIDLRFLTVKEAREWGVKYLEVEIYERIRGARKTILFAKANN